MKLIKKISFFVLALTVLFSLLIPSFASSDSYGFADESYYLIKENYKAMNASRAKLNIGNGRTRMSIDKKWISDNPIWFNAETEYELFLGILDERLKAAYISKESYDKFYKMITDLKNLVEKNTKYLYEAGIITLDEQKYYNNCLRISNLINNYYSELDKSGNDFLMYYSLPHIEALLNLVSYGIIDINDPLMEPSVVLTRSNAIVAALKLLKKDDEIEKNKYVSPYINMPEDAKKYIGYAIENNIIDTAAKGTVWDDSPPSINEVKNLIASVIEASYISGNPDSKVYLYSNIPFRFGTKYNRYTGEVTLEEGFSMTNGDIGYFLSYAFLNQSLRDYPGTILNLHVDNEVIDKAMYRALQIDKFYRDISLGFKVHEEGRLTDLGKFIFAFNTEHQISNSRHFGNGIYFYDKEIMSKYYGVITFDGRNYNEKEVFNGAMTFFTELGLSPSDANALIVKSRVRVSVSMERPIYTGHDFVITGSYNNQYKNLNFHIGVK